MIPLMALEQVLHSLSLTSLTVPSSSSICITSDLALSLASSVSLLVTLSLCPRSLCYPNRESSLPRSSMAVDSHSLRISSASLFAPDSQLLASLMAASILVQNLALAFSYSPAALCLRALSYRSLIPSVSSLVPMCLNPNYPPSPLSLFPQNLASPCVFMLGDLPALSLPFP